MSDSGSWNPPGQAKGRTSLVTASTLVLILLTTLMACGSPPAEPTPAPAPTPAPTPTTVPQTPTPIASVDGQPARASTALVLPDLADVVEKVKPSVASITVESLVRGLFFDFSDTGAGSGIIVRPDGYILTNYHVIEGARQVMVHLASGQTYRARMAGFDRITDLAMLKINAEGLPTAKFARSKDLRVGDWVLTVGNALALKGGATVTLGIVSGLGRTINTERGPFYDLIQTDAAINDGNSGGPLVNLDGEGVGINQAILREAQGMGFAMRGSEALPIIKSLIEHGRVVRPLIGFTGRNVTPAIANELNLTVADGVIITSLSRDGPAYKAGMRVGDVMIKIDDIPTRDVGKWLSLLWSYKVGDQIRVEYLHNNEIFTTTIELTERPS